MSFSHFIATGPLSLDLCNEESTKEHDELCEQANHKAHTLLEPEYFSTAILTQAQLAKGSH